ncbi:DUF5445 family protein [Escherichia coli]|nr:DUF5445 family protein [Escherichia coli]
MILVVWRFRGPVYGVGDAININTNKNIRQVC